MKKYSHLPNTRADALKNNTRFYFTGKPCKYGHYSKRYARRGHCYECDKAKEKDRYLNYKDRHAELMKNWREKHPDYHMQYNYANAEKTYAYNFKYRYKDRIADDWCEKDFDYLVDLFMKRYYLNRVKKQKHFVRVIDKNKPINRFNVELRAVRVDD